MTISKRTDLVLLTLLPLALAQDVTVPTTCEGNFTAGVNEVLYTIPYSYDQVLSIIGNYSNVTWAGASNVATLNGTDNQVGTARTWQTPAAPGLTIIETILDISIPPSPGPYYEEHNTATLTLPDPTTPSANNNNNNNNNNTISFYIPRDITTVTPLCAGQASQFNFTAAFCGTNASVAGGVLAQMHGSWGPMVARLLGGRNYTGCEALGRSEGEKGSYSSCRR